MTFSDEQANFVKLTRVVVDIVPKYLRICFKENWKTKYPNHEWQGNRENGEFLVSEIPGNVKKRGGMTTKNIENIRRGSEETWDTTTLMFVLLFSKLELMPECRQPPDTRSDPLLISEEIDRLREIRNSAFGHVRSTLLASDEFLAIMDRIKNVAEEVFGDDAVKVIVNVQSLECETAKIAKLNQKLEEEMRRNEELKQLQKGNYNICNYKPFLFIDLIPFCDHFCNSSFIHLGEYFYNTVSLLINSTVFINNPSSFGSGFWGRARALIFQMAKCSIANS